MKVLLCNTTDSGGGASKAVMRLLDGLDETEVQANVLVANKRSGYPSVLKLSRFKSKNIFYRLYKDITRKILSRYATHKWAGYPNRTKLALHDVFVSYLENTLQKIEFDILHLHWVEAGFMNFTEVRKIKKPIVWTLHGSFPFTGVCHHLLCDKYKTICGACPALGSEKEVDFSTQNFLLKQKRYKDLDLHVICPSNYLAEHAKESTLLKDVPVHVIPNGISVDDFKPVRKADARKALNLKDKKLILFGAVAAIHDPNKGFQYLLKSLSQLSRIYGDDMQCLIFGADFNSEADFDYKNFGFINNESMLNKLYSAADVMVVPSKHENLPYTVMESLASGTPVTAFNIGGNSDMIDHKQNGYLAEPFEPEDLAAGIQWCLENNEDNSLGKKARQKVIENFRIKDVALRHIELYKTILHES